MTAQATKIVLLCVTVLAAVVIFILSQARFLMVTGTSMEPTITQNDIVVMLPVNSDKLRPGDIIVYRHEVDGKIYKIMHRVIEINEKSLVTKGDALSTVDKYRVRPDDVIGVVVLKIPYVGWFVRFMNTIWGYVLFILMPSTALIIFEIRQIWREIKCKN